MELQKAKATLASYKSHFSRQKKSFDRRLDEFKNHPDVEENWSMLKDAFNKYQKGFDKIEGAFNDVQLLDPSPELEAQFNDAWNNMEEANSEFSKASKKKKDDGGGTPGGGGAANKRVAKSVDSLKPDQLTKSMKPTEFRHWKQRFDDWYATSCFDAMAMEGQLAFLRSVIESELCEQVDFGGATTIKIALERVEAQFMVNHPLLNRRVEFLTMQQKEGQLMSDHIVALNKAGLEADVDKMCPEDWKATRIISSCTDKEMRTKLLEMKPAVANKPTVAELEQVVNSYEARKISEDLLTGGVPRNRRAMEASGVECWKCRQHGHFQHKCPVPKNKLRCTVCNTTGLHNTHDGCQGKKENPKKDPKKKGDKKREKKKDKTRRSVTPGPNGEGSATDTENEDSSSEDRNRRVVARRMVPKSARRVMARRVVAKRTK